VSIFKLFGKLDGIKSEKCSLGQFFVVVVLENLLAVQPAWEFGKVKLALGSSFR
jgi:hypothetical protein